MSSRAELLDPPTPNPADEFHIPSLVKLIITQDTSLRGLWKWLQKVSIMPGTKKQGYNNLVMSIHLSQVYLNDLSEEDRQSEQWKDIIVKERDLCAELLYMSLQKGIIWRNGRTVLKTLQQFPRIHLVPLKDITPANYPEQGEEGQINLGPTTVQAVSYTEYHEYLRALQAGLHHVKETAAKTWKGIINPDVPGVNMSNHSGRCQVEPADSVQLQGCTPEEGI
jgi:hypothetical protein